MQNFQSEAAVWVVMVLMFGFFEKYPKLNVRTDPEELWEEGKGQRCRKTHKQPEKKATRVSL